MARLAPWFLILWALVFGFLASMARAHEMHGVNYQNWTNKAGKGCCNNQDCRPIADADVQFSPALMVRVEGTWCPVLSGHYLQNGNAPDWSSAHICVLGQPVGVPPKGPCERLLCFQPKPLF